MATSHYDALKSYASTTDGVASAAFGFMPATFAPTYELMYGSPGRSLALEIAARIGLSPAIIAAARSNLTTREAQLAAHLAKVDHDMRALEHDRLTVVREREALDAAHARMQQREDTLKQREDAARKKIAEDVESHAREAKKQIEGVIAKLKQKTNALAEEAAKQRLNTGASGLARIEAREAVDAVVRAVLEPASAFETRGGATPHVSAPVSVGARVTLGGLGLEGVITSLHGSTAEVDVRGKRMRASVNDLRVIGAAPGGAAKISVHTELVQRDTQPTELNIIGCTVDEALTRVERFLDESLLSDERVLRFVHGHGTGQLRRAINGFLRQHPLVVSVSQAPPNQGGGGVTVAELKD